MIKKNIQLFVSDLDGTLLQKDFNISNMNVEAIKMLQAAGIYFVVATGRIYFDALTICKKYQLNPYIISNNGGCLFSPEGELLYSRAIQGAMAREIVQFLDTEEICYGLGTSNHYVTCNRWEAIFDNEIERLLKEGKHILNEEVKYTKKEISLQNGIMCLDNIENFFDGTEVIYSISLVTCDETKLKKIKDKLKYYPTLTLSISGLHNAEIIQKLGSKDVALEYLCNLLKIHMNEVAAIGDSLNDKEMLLKAGLGIAVENALKEVKKVCDFEVKAHASDGVAHAIHTILQSKEYI